MMTILILVYIDFSLIYCVDLGVVTYCGIVTPGLTWDCNDE